jgi:hypothetical protein
VPPSRAAALRGEAGAARVELLRLGTAGGGKLRLGTDLWASLPALEAAYRTGF